MSNSTIARAVTTSEQSAAADFICDGIAAAVRRQKCRRNQNRPKGKQLRRQSASAAVRCAYARPAVPVVSLSDGRLRAGRFYYNQWGVWR